MSGEPDNFLAFVMLFCHQVDSVLGDGFWQAHQGSFFSRTLLDRELNAVPRVLQDSSFELLPKRSWVLLWGMLSPITIVIPYIETLQHSTTGTFYSRGTLDPFG